MMLQHTCGNCQQTAIVMNTIGRKDVCCVSLSLMKVKVITNKYKPNNLVIITTKSKPEVKTAQIK